MAELVHYRIWQKGGAIAAGVVYGISLGALFGIVFAYGRKALPGDNNRKKVFLAGILWFVMIFDGRYQVSGESTSSWKS